MSDQDGKMKELEYKIRVLEEKERVQQRKVMWTFVISSIGIGIGGVTGAFPLAGICVGALIVCGVLYL